MEKERFIPDGWREVQLDSILIYEQPYLYIVENEDYTNIGTPVLTAGKSFILGYTRESTNIYNQTPVIIFDDFTTDSKYVDFPFKVKSSAMKFLKCKDNSKNNLLLIFAHIQTLKNKEVGEHKRQWISEFGKKKVLLPTSLSEQQQIASILSAADSAIEQTETLIEKYKNIKKGLMQDLLNPKEGWKMMELESVANIVTGSTPSTQDSSNYGHDYLFVGPGDLGNDIFINKTEKNLSAKGFSLCRKIPKNSILYTCIGSTIGKCGISDCELATNQQINSVIPHKGIDYMYLFYILLSKTEKIKEMAGTQAVPLVNKSLFSQILVPIPDISEQQRIAEILSLVDEQIRRLESSLKKQREQKLGLMDDLLTGRVRVTKLLNN